MKSLLSKNLKFNGEKKVKSRSHYKKYSKQSRIHYHDILPIHGEAKYKITCNLSKRFLSKNF